MRSALVRSLTLASMGLMAMSLAASQTLTLQDALEMARQKNGSLAAARANVRAAVAREKQAFGAFLPTITPSLSYSDTKQEFFTGRNQGREFISSGTTTQIQGTWQLLDSGERDLRFRSARRGFEAETLSALQSLRTTLFDVHTQYFEALRAQQLVNVTTLQRDRAQEVLRQTEAKIKVGEVAEKDRFQAEADALNAEVDLLGAIARLRQSEAALKATIGLDMTTKLPQLEDFAEPDTQPTVPALTDAVNEGLENRADLGASRRRLESNRFGLRLTKLDAGITWSVDLTYTKQFSMDNNNNRFLGVRASIPLFDGDRSRQAVKESEAGVEAAENQLVQQERQVSAEIESALETYRLNFDRVKAAKRALEAAKVNFDKVVRANALGAQDADVVAISTARVSLATAERNYIEAIYDYYISEVRFRLVVGRSIPGED
ncbi:MAG: TolC family protein [Methanoregulaceae archaeon]|nr:TolC family protein [Methanoregulaceae archaeon]